MKMDFRVTKFILIIYEKLSTFTKFRVLINR